MPQNEPRWKQRFRSPRISLPSWARHDPDRCVYVTNATGTDELWSWDRRTGEHTQATSRPAGTVGGSLTPDGTALWWFDDTKGDEKGAWRTQSFGTGPGDAAAAAPLDPGYPIGVALTTDGRAAIGLAGDGRHRVHLVEPDGATTVIYDEHDTAQVSAWSYDDQYLVLGYAPNGDNRNLAVRVVAADGEVVADLWDGDGKGLSTARWAPIAGDQRLLLVHERRGRHHPSVWNPLTGEVTDLDLDLDVLGGELLTVDWYPDAEQVLVGGLGRGRARLARHDLGSGATELIGTEPGMITAARIRPDGELWWSGSTGATPPVVHCGDEILRPPSGDPAPPAGVPYQDVVAEGPGGEVHGFLARPHDATGRPVEGPLPTVFRIHGGPAGVDTDSYSPAVQAWVDHGFAVVMVNYRGSAGYGKPWLDAIVGKPGWRESEDIAAMRDQVVADGIADPDRVVLHGGSWGGYLTLLGLGTWPDRWSLGISAVPLASLRDHYHQQGEVLQAYWRSLFGGTPESLGTALDEIDPICHVDRIGVPVFILVGDNDPRCPLPQVLTYVDALADHGVEHELYRFDAGHASFVIEEQIDQIERCLAFASRHLGTKPPVADGAREALGNDNRTTT